MKRNPLLDVPRFGQSIWLDFIRKGMLLSGEFQALIDEDGLLGVTSNPSIFEKAITGSHDYDDDIRAASLEEKTSEEIYQQLTVKDVQRAADLFHPNFEKAKGKDGYVSLEVSPHLANDTEGTIREARELWKTVARSNALIKVPATTQGIPAIRQLISEGINVNVTLLFDLDRYGEVIEAYISGLESRARAGQSVNEITSVASFFLSRIDVLVDPLLEKLERDNSPRSQMASRVHGQVAIASAKIAYQKYKSIFEGERFKKLKPLGARTQRLLWASTSTKNASESDVKYVEALIGAETVNTLPLETLNAYRDHGNPASRLETEVPAAIKTLECLKELGIDLRKLTQQLEEEGVIKFSEAFDKLMAALKEKRKATLNALPEIQTLHLANYEEAVKERVVQFESEHYCQRLWRKDASLWKSEPAIQSQIKNALGWLHIADKMEDSVDDEIKRFTKEVREAGFEHVVHMGMGGSSLAPLVFARTFSCKEGLPLTVLDTTNPATIKNIKESIPVEKTLFIVASKSGTTAEPLAFKDYFFEQVKQIKGDKAGENFVAITDPNTPLVAMAQEQRFRRIFLNAPDIGGRYSALSYFGLVPAALMGVNISEILIRALQSEHASASCISGHESPALMLGAVLGEMALQGRDKVTLIVDKSITTLGLWLEQLIAESTGKQGTGLIPVSDEPLGSPSSYGNDRLFIHLTVKDSVEGLLRTGAETLRQSGQPVVTIEMSDLLDLGREFFHWEFATALAGSVLGINAFDQPNVQESKDNTNRLLDVKATKRPEPVNKTPVIEGALSLYSGTAATSGPASGPACSGIEVLTRFLNRAKLGNYVALMAYLPETLGTYEWLQTIRLNLRDGLRLATTLGYGPRFLHSTGQLHKGGPNTGMYIQITADDACDLPIPGKSYTFGDFKRAQAQGDLEALHKHGRRAMRIHLGRDIEKGLSELDTLVNLALRSLDAMPFSKVAS